MRFHFSRDVARCDDSISNRHRPALNLTPDMHPVLAAPPLHRHHLTPSRSRSTVVKKLMSTSSQGTSGPSGHSGLRPAFGQPVVSGSHIESNPASISSRQVSTEQSISNQLRRLIVRLLTNVFNLGANDTPGTSNLSKRYGHSTLR